MIYQHLIIEFFNVASKNLPTSALNTATPSKVAVIFYPYIFPSEQKLQIPNVSHPSIQKAYKLI